MGSAAQGMRRTDSGQEQIADPEIRCAMRQRANQLLLYSQGTALVATAVIAVMP